MHKARGGPDFSLGCDNRTKTVIFDGMMIGILIGIIVNGTKKFLKKQGYILGESQDSSSKGDKDSAKAGSSSSRKAKQKKDSKKQRNKKAKQNSNTDVIIEVALDTLTYGFFFAFAAPLMDFFQSYLKVS